MRCSGSLFIGKSFCIYAPGGRRTYTGGGGVVRFQPVCCGFLSEMRGKLARSAGLFVDSKMNTLGFRWLRVWLVEKVWVQWFFCCYPWPETLSWLIFPQSTVQSLKHSYWHVVFKTLAWALGLAMASAVWVSGQWGHMFCSRSYPVFFSVQGTLSVFSVRVEESWHQPALRNAVLLSWQVLFGQLSWVVASCNCKLSLLGSAGLCRYCTVACCRPVLYSKDFPCIQ